MCKLLVFSDTHLTNSNSKFKKNKDGVSDLLIAQHDFFHMIADELRSGEYEGWLFLGDLTDQNQLDTITLYYVNSALAALDATGVPGIMVGGNHTITDSGNVYTILSALSKFNWRGGTRFYHSPARQAMGNIEFYICPYNSDYEELENQIGQWNDAIEDDGKYHILLFHFPTKNAMLDNGLPSTSGVNLSQNLISRFTLAIGGDFHTPQKICGTKHAYYVGAPFDLRFGERCDRSFTRLELRDGSYKLGKLENPFNHPMLKLTPEDFLTVRGSESVDLSKAIVRLTEPPSPDDRIEIEAMRDQVYSLYIPKVKFESSRSEEAQQGVEIIDASFSEADDVKVVKEFLSKMEVQEDVSQEAIRIFEKVI